MPYTNTDLVAFVQNAYSIKARYWYGTYWLKATSSLYNSKKGQYPSQYTSSRAAQYQKDIADGKMVADCSGLIKGFFWSKNNTQTSKYGDGFPDVSANQMISSCCSKTGSINTLPEVPGLLLWHDGHIGVYIGGGYAIEARGFSYGVVKTNVKDRSWEKWGQMSSKYLTYDQSVDPTPIEFGDRPLEYGDEGDDVKQLQTLLIGWNYSCGKWGADGDFGSATESAVVAWQHANGLPETGVVDDDDYAKIDELLTPDEGGDDDGDGDGGDPEPNEQYVTVTSGSAVNIRTAPNTGASVLGIAKKGDTFEYAGETAENGWFSILYHADTGWISSKYTTLSDAAVPDDGGNDSGDGGDPEPEDQHVEVTSGSTVNVRSQPNTDAKVLGVAKLGDAYPYAGETAENGWFSILYQGNTGWISNKYTTLEDGPAPEAEKAIVDLDSYSDLKSDKNDWGKLAQSVNFVILRCGVTRTSSQPMGIGSDPDFTYACQRCIEHGIPFGVYYYGHVNDPDDAREEADFTWEIASPFAPLFYVYDVEEASLTPACVTAWADQIRAHGAKKAGIYVAHNLYTQFQSTVGSYDFVWIPRYGQNTGEYEPKYAPAYPCDLHQYTSVGQVPGIADDTLDLNRLTGSKPLSWFLEA